MHPSIRHTTEGPIPGAIALLVLLLVAGACGNGGGDDLSSVPPPSPTAAEPATTPPTPESNATATPLEEPTPTTASSPTPGTTPSPSAPADAASGLDPPDDLAVLLDGLFGEGTADVVYPFSGIITNGVPQGNIRVNSLELVNVGVAAMAIEPDVAARISEFSGMPTAAGDYLVVWLTTAAPFLDHPELSYQFTVSTDAKPSADGSDVIPSGSRSEIDFAYVSGQYDGTQECGTAWGFDASQNFTRTGINGVICVNAQSAVTIVPAASAVRPDGLVALFPQVRGRRGSNDSGLSGESRVLAIQDREPLEFLSVSEGSLAELDPTTAGSSFLTRFSSVR